MDSAPQTVSEDCYFLESIIIMTRFSFRKARNVDNDHTRPNHHVVNERRMREKRRKASRSILLLALPIILLLTQKFLYLSEYSRNLLNYSSYLVEMTMHLPSILSIAGSSSKNNKAVRISQPDEFLLFDWPTPGVLASDFTMELWYRTEYQATNRTNTNVTTITEKEDDAVAIVSNHRVPEDAKQYGRHFGMYFVGSTGSISVRFEGYRPLDKKFFSGSIESTSERRLDDGQWHFLRLVRSNTNITLTIDGSLEGSAVMPINVDYDGQEQRVVIGGGNGRRFRECELDNLRVWTAARRQEDAFSSCPTADDNSDLELIMHLAFDDVSAGVMLHDCAPRGGGALRVGSQLRTSTAFVDGAPKATLCTDCTSWPTPPNNITKETGVVTYLGVACNGKGPQDEIGGMYQLEAYICALWLDVN
jgi:hypothetical protein